MKKFLDWIVDDGIIYVFWFLIITVTLLFVLFVCLYFRPPKITKGQVVDKIYHPPKIIPIMVFINKVPITTMQNKSETFQIIISQVGVQQKFNVDKEFYNNVKIGQFVDMKTKRKKNK